MPIYAYRCTSCGFEKDVMQKVSEPKLTTCPQCATENFAKQLTAPGFQLKGTGWYATDFKGGGNAKAAVAKSETGATLQPGGESGGSGTSPATAEASPATAAPVAAPATTQTAAPNSAA